MPISIATVTFGATSSLSVSSPQMGGGEDFGLPMIVVLITPEIDSAPGTLTVSVVGTGDEPVVFKILGREVLRVEPDDTGDLEYLSVPVPDLRDSGSNHLIQPGTHTLSVTQGAYAGSADFTVVNPPPPWPEEIPADVPPVVVPAAILPSGVRRWVLQDLMPGGLGSWVMPMNPLEMESPAFIRDLTARSTTATEELGGQFHIYENVHAPVEWPFSGYCPTEEMREKLEAFADLNRRWYLHDHRGRAWKVTFQSLELTPRLTQIWNGEYTDEGHDYKATVLVLERAWIEVS